jgi:superfamily II DNA/RNA helicase
VRAKKVGIPDSREQYIHRLGRTGRGGQAGRGILVLAPHEKPFLKVINNTRVMCTCARKIEKLTGNERKYFFLSHIFYAFYFLVSGFNSFSRYPLVLF